MGVKYIANRKIKDHYQGKDVTYMPGDVIPNFHEWNIHAFRAHLSLEWVLKVDDEANEIVKEPVKQAKSKKSKKAPKIKQGASITEEHVQPMN